MRMRSKLHVRYRRQSGSHPEWVNTSVDDPLQTSLIRPKETGIFLVSTIFFVWSELLHNKKPLSFCHQLPD